MKWVIVAGGTGGHIFPGIALAEYLLQQKKEVVFISGKRKVEKEILKNRPFSVYELDVEGFLGKSLINKIKAFNKMIKAILKSYKLIKNIDPDIILATGGYISFPVVLVGKLQRKVLGLHEQNIEPGMANKILSKLVDKIFISIKGSEKFFPKEKVIFSGNIIRKEILTKVKKEHTGKGLLIIGGSLGAKFINELATEIVPLLLKEIEDLRIIHQTGLDNYKEVRDKYNLVIKNIKNAKERLTILPFIENMAWAYSQADLVLSRAGATTLAELFATGKPAILIPFPYATRNHQEKNAKAVAEKGGAIVIRQNEADSKKVYKIIKNLLNNPQKLKNMSDIMHSFFIKDSEKIIINTLEGLVKNAQ